MNTYRYLHFNIWNYHFAWNDRTVSIHVCHVRQGLRNRTAWIKAMVPDKTGWVRIVPFRIYIYVWWQVETYVERQTLYSRNTAGNTLWRMDILPLPSSQSPSAASCPCPRSPPYTSPSPPWWDASSSWEHRGARIPEPVPLCITGAVDWCRLKPRRTLSPPWERPGDPARGEGGSQLIRRALDQGRSQGDGGWSLAFL